MISSGRIGARTTGRLPSACITLALVVVSAEGMTSATEPDYERHGFPWEHNTLGLDDRVAPGFAPVEVVTGTVHATGRAYRLGDALLPSSIVSAGAELLSRPMELIVESDGEGQGAGRFTSTVRAATGSEVVIENVLARTSYDTIVGYRVGVDGFVRVDVSIRPKRRLRIDRLAVRGALLATRAERYDRHLDYDFDRQRIDRGDLLESSGSTSTEPTFSFSPTIWLGRDSVGLEFIAETNVHLRLEDPRTAHRVRRNSEAVELTNTLVDEPFETEDPLEFSFALLATPVVRSSSLPRTTLLTSRRSPIDRTRTFDELYVGHWRRDRMPLPGIPVPAPAGSKDRQRHDALRERLDEADIRYLAYSALHLMPTTLPELASYRDAWAAAPSRRGSSLWSIKLRDPKPVQPVSLDSRSIHDFIIHTHVRELTANAMAGVYFDVAAPDSLSATTERYLRANAPEVDGGTVVYYPIFAQREFLLRYWKATKQIDPSFVIAHHGNHFPRFAQSFIDLAVFGESIHGLFDDDAEGYVPDYLSLPADVVPGSRAPGDSAAHVLLPQVKRSNEAYLKRYPARFELWSRSAIGVWLLNDFRIWNTRIHGPTLASVVESLADFDGFDDAEFSRRPADERLGVETASYSTSDESLVVYVNRSEATVSVDVTIADIGRRKGTILGASAVASNRPVEEKGSAWRVTIPPRDFALVRLHTTSRSDDRGK